MSGRSWEAIARTQPYWGVLSHDQFLTARLDEAALAEFWASGEQHVAAIFDTLHSRLSARPAPATAVDFGCGVGRLLAPLASRATHVVGVDASPTMLALAAENVRRRGVNDCMLVGSVTALRAVVPSYDFLHSALVFQHIRPTEGYALFRELLAGLASGGFGAVHFRLRGGGGPRRALRSVRARSRMLGRAAAAVRGAPPEAALVEVHGYDLGQLVAILYESGVGEVFTGIAGEDGLDATLAFRKS
jgi:SAM-dependent methyltransferase